MNFTTTTTSTTFIYIIGLLALVGIIIYFYNEFTNIKKKDETIYKDLYYAPCPDYWETTGENKCNNNFKLGSCAVFGNTEVDLNDAVFSNKLNGNYAKCKWAKGCNISWNNIDRLC